MASEELQGWIACKEQIATCHECIDRWPLHVENPLSVEEVPNPPRDVSILFVGVAPPPLGSADDDEVGHFYSNPCDRLRLGLFHILDQIFKTEMTQRNRVSREAGTSAFLDGGFFFLHAAKVRPCRGRLAPTRRIMRFCAQHHLPDEIALLQPHAICFLGATNAAPAAETVFRHHIGEVPEQGVIRRADGTQAWRGWVAVTVQPVRGTKESRNRDRAAKSIEQLRKLANAAQ
jgi:uracil-DNA glycosylase